MSLTDPAEGIGERIGVLRALARSSGRARDPDHSSRVAKSVGIKVKYADLWNTEIGLTHWRSLVEEEAGSIEPQFVQHRATEGARPTDCSDVVGRLEG